MTQRIVEMATGGALSAHSAAALSTAAGVDSAGGSGAFFAARGLERLTGFFAFDLAFAFGLETFALTAFFAFDLAFDLAIFLGFATLAFAFFDFLAFGFFAATFLGPFAVAALEPANASMRSVTCFWQCSLLRKRVSVLWVTPILLATTYKPCVSTAFLMML